MKNNIIISKKFLVVLSLVLFVLISSIAFAEEQLWSVKTSSTGYYGRTTCFVAYGKKCPYEMSWMGNQVHYVFRIDTKDLNEKVNLVFNVPFKNYRTSEDVILEIKAGKSLFRMQTIVSDLKIDHLGVYSIPIDSSVFRDRWPNYIRLKGKNIRPIGYGKNPPNFQISSIKLEG